MILVMIFAVIILLLGVVFMLGRDTLKKLDSFLNKSLVAKDKELGYKYNKILGIILIALAFSLFYISLTVRK